MRQKLIGLPSYARVITGRRAPRAPTAPAGEGFLWDAPPAGPTWAVASSHGPWGIGVSCRAWNALDATGKASMLFSYADKYSMSKDPGEISNAINSFDAFCAQPLPTLASLGVSCDGFATLTQDERVARVSSAMAIRNSAGAAILPANVTDVHDVVQSLLTDCLRQVAQAASDKAAADAAQAAANAAAASTTLRVTIRAPGGTMPSDIAALLDGQAMQLVSQTSGVARPVAPKLPAMKLPAPAVTPLRPTIRILPGGVVTHFRRGALPDVAPAGVLTHFRHGDIAPAGQTDRTNDVAIFELTGPAAFNADGSPRTLIVMGTGISAQRQSISPVVGQTTETTVTVAPIAAAPAPSTPYVPTQPQPTNPLPGTPAVGAGCQLPTNPSYLMQEATPPGQTPLRIDPFFATDAERSAWIAAHPSCPTPPVFAGATAPAPDPCALPNNPSYGMPDDTVHDPYFYSERDRQAWIAAHPTCPTPPPLATGSGFNPIFGVNPQQLIQQQARDTSGILQLCPPTPPTFTSEADRQAWITANPGCPQPPAVGMSTAMKVGIAVAAVATAGGVAYWAYNRKGGWKSPSKGK